MADDWIRIRTDIYRDPKVCLMAKHIQNSCHEMSRNVTTTVTRSVTRHIVVGCLVTIWGVIRHRGQREDDDLRINCAITEVLDDITDMPGFGAAMESVGWVRQERDSIVFPSYFKEYNSEPKKTEPKSNAERKRDQREKEKMSQCHEMSRNVTSEKRDVSRNVTTEERREEKRLSTNVESVVQPTKTKHRFVKPTVEEVRAYVATRTKKIDPERFIDHYESNGWKVGRNQMKDWKATARTWEKNEFQSASRNGSTQPDCLDAANYVGAPCMSEEEAGVPF